MSRMKNYTPAQQLLADFQQITIPTTPAVKVQRPTDSLPLYVELEMDKRRDEQLLAYTARGEEQASEDDVEAARLTQITATLASQLVDARQVSAAASTLYCQAVTTYGPLVQRSRFGKIFFGLRTVGLLCGDIVGQASAVILLGELPTLALLQATATGIAVVTAGLLGSEVKAHRWTKKYVHLLHDTAPTSDAAPDEDAGTGIAKRMAWLSLGIGGAAVIGVTALRTVLDDALVGLCFGAFAAAIAGASYVSSYVATDPAADRLARALSRLRDALRFEQRLARSGEIGKRAAHVASAAGIRTHNELQGLAAGARVEAEKYGTLRRNPHVAGHGPNNNPIGKRHRIEEAS